MSDVLTAEQRLTIVDTRYAVLQRMLDGLYAAQTELLNLNEETAQRLNPALMRAVVAVQEERGYGSQSS